MVTALSRFGLGSRIAAVVLLLSALAAGLGWLGIDALGRLEEKATDTRNGAKRALIGQTINGLVYAVVMDSRGVYMAKDAGDARRYGEPLLKNLKTIESKVAEWERWIGESERADFDVLKRTVAEFVRFRAEMVKAGYEQGPAAADRIGNNDDNRKNRQKLNAELQKFVDRNDAELSVLDRSAAEFYEGRHATLVIALASGILTALALTAFIVVVTLIRPLRALTASMRSLAAGDTTVAVPGQNYRDEIGAMAAAVLVFRDQARRNIELVQEQQSARAVAAAQRSDALRGMAETIERATSQAVA
jgi:methyl-accepting chemotaxis protein